MLSMVACVEMCNLCAILQNNNTLHWVCTIDTYLPLRYFTLARVGIILYRKINSTCHANVHDNLVDLK